MMTMTTTPKPFKKLDEVYVQHHVPGQPYGIGQSVTILSVINQGTKRNPSFRYYVAGAWFDHDALGYAKVEA